MNGMGQTLNVVSECLALYFHMLNMLKTWPSQVIWTKVDNLIRVDPSIGMCCIPARGGKEQDQTMLNNSKTGHASI